MFFLDGSGIESGGTGREWDLKSRDGTGVEKKVTGRDGSGIEITKYCGTGTGVGSGLAGAGGSGTNALVPCRALVSVPPTCTDGFACRFLASEAKNYRQMFLYGLV